MSRRACASLGGQPLKMGLLLCGVGKGFGGLGWEACGMLAGEECGANLLVCLHPARPAWGIVWVCSRGRHRVGVRLVRGYACCSRAARGRGGDLFLQDGPASSWYACFVPLWQAHHAYMQDL